jgi:phosphoesterase RecJ-like protein
MHTGEQILGLIRKLGCENVAIVCHRNADPDALSSAYSLKCLILERCPSVAHIGIVADEINQVSRKLVEVYPETAVLEQIDFRPDMFILADVNSIEHTGRFAGIVGSNDGPIIVIDHHVPQMRTDNNFAITLVNEEASSTAEIVASLSESIGRKPSKTEATLLLTGIVYDSKRFSIIGKDVFHTADFLLGSGGDYKTALSILRKAAGRSEKIARLKAAQRVRVIEMSGWIVACSAVSSFGASACRALIDLGSDVAIVTSKKKKEYRITTRSSNAFHETTGINLAKLVERIGRELGGHGGGHATAATVSGIREANEGERRLLEYIEEQTHRTSDNPTK